MTENNDMEVSDTNASELINKVFDMPLQSYDDFISDFIYLTKGNDRHYACTVLLLMISFNSVSLRSIRQSS